MSYLVEAYFSYNDYLEGKNHIFIFKNKDEYKRLYLDNQFFTNLYISSKGGMMGLNFISDNRSDEDE